MDVAVIGGGIVGLASAYSLATDGHAVTVYEMGSLGNGSTERSAGGIRRQFSTPVNVELSKASLAVWADFADEFGVDIDFRRPGYLFLARRKSTANSLKNAAKMQRAHDVPTEILDPESAREHCPGLRSERFSRATYLSTDGFADPHLALQGYAERARELGVDVLTNTAVTDIVRRHGRVEAVEVEGTRQQVDYVVNAAGPWARRVAAMADLSLPVAPKRRQVLVVEPERAVPETVPLTIDLDTGSYFRPEREGDALVGGHFAESDPDEDPDRYSESVGLEYTLTALEQAADVASYFGPESGRKRAWAGLYAVTPDDHPILEESAPGLISAVGFSGHGFQHAPATGALVAELITEGAASVVDISGLERDRFESGDSIEETYVA